MADVKYDVLGIGNALFDVLVRTDEAFLAQHGMAKGSMALISRYSAVAKIGKLEFGGFIAWLAWLLLHLYYLIGHRNRIAAMFAWGISFLGRTRGQMAITSQMMYARPVVDWVERQAQEGTLAAAERIEAAEKAG